MKQILLNIILKDKSYNKSETRYLYKNYPELWKEIVNKTLFLPENVPPKQRVWHIINDCYEVPKCPITNLPLKWQEKNYLKTINRTAAIKLQYQRGDFKNSFTEEINEKRRQGNLKAVKTGRKYRDKSTYTDIQKEKQKQTFLKKYGVDNPSKNINVKKKISDANCIGRNSETS